VGRVGRYVEGVRGRGLRQVQAAQGKSAAVAVAADASSAVDCTFGRNPSARSSEASGRKKTREPTTKAREQAIYHFTL